MLSRASLLLVLLVSVTAVIVSPTAAKPSTDDVSVTSVIVSPTAAKPSTDDVSELKLSDDVTGALLTDDLDTESSSDDDDNGDDVIYDTNIVLDGIPLHELSPEEQELLLEDQDYKMTSELDIFSLKQLLADRKSAGDDVRTVAPPPPPPSSDAAVGAGMRKKRWAPLLWTAGRVLFSAATRAAVSRSGTRITQQYIKHNTGFRSAVRDFNRMGVQNINRIRGNNSGYTGTLGRHRVTVRSRSSGGRPTMEVRTPRADGTTYVRKFRY